MRDKRRPGGSRVGCGFEHKVRVGVIGIGFGQQVHVPAFRGNERCEVVGICASTQERARAVASRLEIPKAYGDWRELIGDPEIDAVSISTPAAVQVNIVKAALEERKHVFCEKPLATSCEAARAMLTAANNAGTANMVDFEFPEVEEWMEAKRILTAGTLGHLRHVHVSWYVETYANRLQLRSWKTNTAEGGGTLNGFVSHCFYYLEWLFGPVRKVWAGLFHDCESGSKIVPQGDTLAIVCLELDTGTPVSVSVGSNAFLGTGHRVEVYGDAGTLVLENRGSDYVGGFNLLLGTRETNCLKPVGLPRRLSVGGQDGRVVAVGRLVERFVRWILTGSPEVPSFADGYRVQVLLEAARASHGDGTWWSVLPSGPERDQRCRTWAKV